MRNHPIVRAERFRRHDFTFGESAWALGNNGAFSFPAPNGKDMLNVIISDGSGAEDIGLECPWDHVSVSLPSRCPTWEEMCFIKDIFFRDDEWVIQFHPAKKDYVNNHPYCLHLWRPHGEFAKPPAWTVGVQGIEL